MLLAIGKTFALFNHTCRLENCIFVVNLTENALCVRASYAAHKVDITFKYENIVTHASVFCCKDKWYHCYREGVCALYSNFSCCFEKHVGAAWSYVWEDTKLRFALDIDQDGGWESLANCLRTKIAWTLWVPGEMIQTTTLDGTSSKSAPGMKTISPQRPAALTRCTISF